MSLRPALVLAAALALTAGTAGCGSSRATVAPVPVSAVAVDLVTQDGGYAAGQKAITDAEDRLVARCMTAAGLRYVVGKRTPAVPETATDYGLYAKYAKKAADPVSNKATNDYYLAHRPASERAAYLEVLRSPEQAAVRLADGREITYSTRGCEPAARAALYGDLVTQVKVFYVPQIVNSAVEKEVRQDSRYLAARAAWRECMAAGGAPYSSDGDARRQMNAMYEKTGPTAGTHRREIAVATLDHSCATKARLTETEGTLVRAALAALPEPDRRELDQLAASWQRTVAAARSTA